MRASETASLGVLVTAQPTFPIFTLPAHTLENVRDAEARGPVEVVAYDQTQNQSSPLRDRGVACNSVIP